ncbi:MULTISPECIES: DUF4145 domain-containing protein [unclassified Staphylococcus]|uniref:DUF4145 domain-containing protein n=1 Tax=unclassified Staphylococcus TaxID=91994 RepID=UPI0008C28F03|nr:MULTISPECIES: DUF4145 domain-containing protein [unclassified Staphylococcus]OFM20193.1 hypothetical protein HMPREF2713_10685 [Staphylococcus sp. HMSC059E03]OFN20592.1 hypothetical protein HMPREF2603_06820 [Staphylococcus sp. HMSC055C03]OHR53434.1 hypothetical protein HMPREF2798_08090 [Staphylococcus sp. HMSC070A03]OHR55528.1 hypothetical protein HMPREF3021_09895 [Staphylococcus sp. HMSC070A02]
MEKSILKCSNESGTSYLNVLFYYLDKCPICHNYAEPKVSLHSALNAKLESNLVITFQCSHPKCKRFYCLEYQVNYRFDNSIAGYRTELLEYPEIPDIYYPFPKSLEKISPKFKEIYLQSKQAENKKLNEIAGVGYRKAIEFLVKDYLIYMKEDENFDDIKAKPLAQCIKKIDNNSIVKLAKAISYLGNDETHYYRKIKNKDITDMKKLIHSLGHFVSAELSVLDADEIISLSTNGSN